MSDDSALNPAAKVYGWELRLDTAASGVKNAFPATANEIILHGVPYTQPALLAEAQDVVAPWKAVRDAKAVIRAFAQNKKALVARARKFLGELQAGITVHTGLESEVLTEYGFKPKRRKKPLPVEKNAIRVAKAKLTRLRRGTKGKRQKEALKFTGQLQVQIAPDGTSQVIDLSATPPQPEAVAVAAPPVEVAAQTALPAPPPAEPAGVVPAPTPLAAPAGLLAAPPPPPSEPSAEAPARATAPEVQASLSPSEGSLPPVPPLAPPDSGSPRIGP
jgi:hypothetical protein